MLITPEVFQRLTGEVSRPNDVEKKNVSNLADLIRAGGNTVIVRAKVGDEPGTHLHIGYLRPGDGSNFFLGMSTPETLVELLYAGADTLTIDNQIITKEHALAKVKAAFGVSTAYWANWKGRQFDARGIYADLSISSVKKVEVIGLDNVGLRLKTIIAEP